MMPDRIVDLHLCFDELASVRARCRFGVSAGVTMISDRPGFAGQSFRNLQRAGPVCGLKKDA